MFLLKAALLCSLYNLGQSSNPGFVFVFKGSPSEVQSISGLAEYEYPLLEKLLTRIGDPYTSMQGAVERNSFDLEEDDRFDTNRVNAQVAKNPRGSG